MRKKKYRPRATLWAAVTILVMVGVWVSKKDKTSDIPVYLEESRTAWAQTAEPGSDPASLGSAFDDLGTGIADTGSGAAVLVHTTETDRESVQSDVPPPETAYIDGVPILSQKDIAPTGCELVSAQMILEYYGVDADFDTLAGELNCANIVVIDGYLHAPHPQEAFIGSPYSSESYGCYALPILNVMNKFLPSGKRAVDTTGTELSELVREYIPNGQPLLIWATINMVETEPWGGWYLLDKNGDPTNEWFDWMVHEHCLALVGYDEDSYIFHDPHEDNGEIRYPKDVVEQRYDAMGRYSIVVETVY